MWPSCCWLSGSCLPFLLSTWWEADSTPALLTLISISHLSNASMHRASGRTSPLITTMWALLWFPYSTFLQWRTGQTSVMQLWTYQEKALVPLETTAVLMAISTSYSCSLELTSSWTYSSELSSSSFKKHRKKKFCSLIWTTSSSAGLTWWRWSSTPPLIWRRPTSPRTTSSERPSMLSSLESIFSRRTKPRRLSSKYRRIRTSSWRTRRTPRKTWSSS